MIMKESQPRAIYLKDYQQPDYWINKTDLTFELEEKKTTVTAQVTFTLNDSKHKEKMPPLTLHGEDMKLFSVSIDNEILSPDDYTLTHQTLTLPVKTKQFTTTIVSEIDPANNTTLEGLYKSAGLFCTQCEAEGFRKITWYLDRPDVMSCFTTKIIADKKRYPVLLSNGNPIEQGTLGNGKHFVTWEDPFKKPSYLFALVAGDLAIKTDHFTTCSDRNITLKIFSEPHNIDQCDHAMDALKKSMRWDEEVYGREYDLDIFMIVAVDDFNMGAMENKGLNIFNASCVLAKSDTATDAAHQRVEAVVAHEYFHNWSGNRVTCRDWFQLSLKEGFTVFRDMSFSSDMNSATVKRIQDVNLLRTAQFAEDSGPMAHPVRPASFMEISNFYTLTVYEKGAEVVRMLHTLTGPEGFRKGTDLYFDRHDGQAVTCEDFVKALEDANHIDLSQFRLWYSQAGTPTISARDHYNAETKQYTLTLQQILPDSPDQLGSEKQPMHIPISFGLIDANNGQTLSLNGEGQRSTIIHLTEQQQNFTFDHIASRPVPSLLRGFSAPVKLEYDYTTENLQRLMQFDEDLFNRWDSCQRLMLKRLLTDIQQLQSNQPLTPDQGLLSACQTLLTDQNADLAVVAEMLLPPSENLLAEQMNIVDVDAIHQARKHLKLTLAKALEFQLVQCYQSLHTKAAYKPEATEIAKRSLKNVCLGLLSMLDKSDYLVLAQQQFEQANNMTDQQAALCCLINGAHTSAKDKAQNALSAFHHQWKHDSNVMNMWLSAQSTSPVMGTLAHIQYLLTHESFDYKNPNKLRSVIGAFAANNPVQFHLANGDGYNFLSSHIVKLDQQNPQVASRLLTPLTRWRRYDEKRCDKMCKALQFIKNKAQSPDVQEVVIKSLQM